MTMTRIHSAPGYASKADASQEEQRVWDELVQSPDFQALLTKAAPTTPLQQIQFHLELQGKEPHIMIASRPGEWGQLLPIPKYANDLYGRAYFLLNKKWPLGWKAASQAHPASVTPTPRIVPQPADPQSEMFRVFTEMTKNLHEMMKNGAEAAAKRDVHRHEEILAFIKQPNPQRAFEPRNDRNVHWNHDPWARPIYDDAFPRERNLFPQRDIPNHPQPPHAGWPQRPIPNNGLPRNPIPPYPPAPAPPPVNRQRPIPGDAFPLRNPLPQRPIPDQPPAPALPPVNRQRPIPDNLQPPAVGQQQPLRRLPQQYGRINPPPPPSDDRRLITFLEDSDGEDSDWDLPSLEEPSSEETDSGGVNYDQKYGPISPRYPIPPSGGLHIAVEEEGSTSESDDSSSSFEQNNPFMLSLTSWRGRGPGRRGRRSTRTDPRPRGGGGIERGTPFKDPRQRPPPISTGHTQVTRAKPHSFRFLRGGPRRTLGGAVAVLAKQFFGKNP